VGPPPMIVHRGRSRGTALVPSVQGAMTGSSVIHRAVHTHGLGVIHLSRLLQLNGT